MSKVPVRIAVTGAAGQIGYALIFRIASGDLLGAEQPVILQLLETPAAMPALGGVVMELEDCAFPLLQGIAHTDNPALAFRDADIAILIGARAHSKGMDHTEQLKANATIFAAQGKALNAIASRKVKVLVVGHPANTNAWVTMMSAPDLPRENFTAMLRLDHDRALAQLARHTGKPVDSIEKVFVWGKHSASMYADLRYATANGEALIKIIDQDWYHGSYIPTIGKRSAAVIEARGLSPAASAANAAIAHIRDWILGSQGRWVTMGVCTDGSYGLPPGLIYGLPVTTENGTWSVVQNLEIDPHSRAKLDLEARELLEERNSVKQLLG